MFHAHENIVFRIIDSLGEKFPFTIDDLREILIFSAKVPTREESGDVTMTQSIEIPVQEFALDWTMSSGKGGRVGFAVSGQVTLLDNKRFYKIDGVLYISEGSAYCRDIGNPHLFVRRNGVEESGRQWGWETICNRKSCSRLCAMDAYFVRTGYWAPADRAIQLSIGAETGWNRKRSFSPTVTVRLAD